jgi:gliding motility-associated protein GldE
MDYLIIVKLIVICVSLCLSAIFSGSETAFFSLSKIEMQKMIRDGRKNARAVKRTMEKARLFLISILFGNTLLNIIASSLATVLFIDAMQKLNIAQELQTVISVVVTIVVMPFLILIFGEITPKTYALHYAEKIALKTIREFNVYFQLLRPLFYLLEKISAVFTRIFDRLAPRHDLTVEEIRTMVKVSEENGILEEEEKEMLESVFEFGKTTVREVMSPRTDMVCVEAHTEFNELIRMIREEGHSRIPVFEENVDNILGIIYAKDLLAYLPDQDDFELSKVIKKPYFVPESKLIDDLLKEFQKRKIHLAIVVDEYGGTSGLVTLEDLLEEIVGEIFDEYDVTEQLYEVIDDSTIRIDAKIDIDDFNELAHTELPGEGYDTLGGFLLDQLGKFPTPGEAIEYDDMKFTVEKVTRHRIRKVRVHLDTPLRGPDNGDRKKPDNDFFEDGKKEN